MIFLVFFAVLVFLSTPSARRATGHLLVDHHQIAISIHALREEGDASPSESSSPRIRFLSTPSARRATQVHHLFDLGKTISIHALREEGDEVPMQSRPRRRYFYPRPPRGGRRGRYQVRQRHFEFLSTPSARRATDAMMNRMVSNFISIHALREEGDAISITGTCLADDFYPRPPRGGRRTAAGLARPSSRISIHALREEGDSTPCPRLRHSPNFYPRPPRGGRQIRKMLGQRFRLFLSTPSARRATYPAAGRCNQMRHFYPRPPRGGRQKSRSPPPAAR